MAQAAKQPTQQPKKAVPKKDNTLKIVLIVIGVLVGIGILSAIAITVLFVSVFHSATKDVNVDKKGGSVTVKTNNGQSSASYGNDVKLPQGFPTDVPVYKPSTIIYATKTETTRFSVAAKTSASMQTVLDYYKSELTKQGWESTHESSYGDGTLLSYTKDGRTLSVTVSSQNNEATDKTFITIIAQPAE